MDSQRISRIFDVVTHLALHGPQTVSQLSSRLELPLSSTHDLLKAMVETKALHVSGRTYGIGSMAISMALSVMDSVAVHRVARRHLEMLVQEIGFDVYLAMATGTRVVYVTRYAGRQRVNLDIPLGRSLLLHSTAVGKLFAAHRADIYQTMMSKPRPAQTPNTRTTATELDRDLSAIRKAGVSISRGEGIRGIVGLATPVRDPQGAIVAAVHVSALRTSLPTKAIDQVVRAMQSTSAAIETELSELMTAASA